jgi:hypothetical protein
MIDQNILKTRDKLKKEQTTTNNKKPFALITFSPPLSATSQVGKQGNLRLFLFAFFQYSYKPLVNSVLCILGIVPVCLPFFSG